MACMDNEEDNGDAENRSLKNSEGIGSSPERVRFEFATKAREYLNNRSRVVAAAIIALSWGWAVSDPKLAVPIPGWWKVALIIAGTLSLLALLLDYAQYLFEYMDASSLRGKYWGEGGRMMFRLKQLLTSASAVILISTACLILMQAVRTEAQPGVAWRVYTGFVWSHPDQSDKKASKLFLTHPNPVTGLTNGSEDGVACKGTQTEATLVLVCDATGVRFYGAINDNGFRGEWTATSVQDLKGRFTYQYVKEWRQP
jgi:hypothetical protein